MPPSKNEVRVFIRSVLRNAAAEGDAGGGAPAPAAQPPADNKPAAAKPPPADFEENKARTAGELKAFIAAQRAAEAAEDAPAPAAEPAKGNEAAIEAAPTKAAEKAAKELDNKGEKVPEQKTGESDEKYTLRLAKMAQDLRDMEAEKRRERTGRETAEKKASELESAVKKYEQQIARGKNKEDALDFLLDTTGLTLEDLVKGINDGTIKPPRAKAALPPDVAAALEEDRKERQRLAKQLEEMQAKETEREQERQQAQQQELLKSHVTQATSWLEENADDFPCLAVTSWAPSNLVQRVYAAKNPDLIAPARALEDAIAGHMIAIAGDERAMKALAKREPELSKKLAAALGWSSEAPPAPASPNAPAKRDAKPVSKVSSEAPTPKKLDDLPWEERKAHVSVGLAQRIKEMREQQ